MHSEADIAAYRHIWFAVLARGIGDALARVPRGSSPSDAKLIRAAAEAWIGSEDFCRVCDLAGVDGKRLTTAVEKLRAEIRDGKRNWYDLPGTFGFNTYVRRYHAVRHEDLPHDTVHAERMGAGQDARKPRGVTAHG